jgi:anti-anti-sigma regulatory factor
MTPVFELPTELTIYYALEVRDALLAWVADQAANAKHALAVSAAQVSVVDGAGLQLLAALSHSEKDWRLVDPSTEFVEACKSMGLERWLDEHTSTADATGA